MKPMRFVLASVASLMPGHMVHADPIHATADGAYWHHDSGWVFAHQIGEFTLVGIPQDVAGSADAVAYYARVVNGRRMTASVDLYAPDSAAAEAAPAEVPAGLVVDKAHALSASRIVQSGEQASELTATYFVTAGEWRVRIRISGAAAGSEPELDAFVTGQRWSTLTSVRIPQ